MWGGKPPCTTPGNTRCRWWCRSRTRHLFRDKQLGYDWGTSFALLLLWKLDVHVKGMVRKKMESHDFQPISSYSAFFFFRRICHFRKKYIYILRHPFLNHFRILKKAFFEDIYMQTESEGFRKKHVSFFQETPNCKRYFQNTVISQTYGYDRGSIYT